MDKRIADILEKFGVVSLLVERIVSVSGNTSACWGNMHILLPRTHKVAKMTPDIAWILAGVFMTALFLYGRFAQKP